MTRADRLRLALAAGSSILVAAPVSAQLPPSTGADPEAATTGGELADEGGPSTYVNFDASVGYASNPFLDFGDDTGSLFGRISAFAAHEWRSERSETRLSAFVENTTYAQHYGSEQIFDLQAATVYDANERLRLFGRLGFSGDLSGQLGTRFVDTPGRPPSPEPGVPPPPEFDPDFAALNGRQYRLTGQAGATMDVGTRDTVTISGGAERVFHTNDRDDLDYMMLFATGAYDHQLSERSAVGGRIGIQHANYHGADNYVLTITPQITGRTMLSEDWEASGAVGLAFAKERTPDEGSDTSTNLSFEGTICRTSPSERFCARAARYQQTNTAANLTTTSSIGVEYFNRLDAVQTIQAGASFVRYAGSAFEDDGTYMQASGTYTRQLNDRMFAGANLAARKFSDKGGPDPRPDFSGSLFVRYRLGDLL